MKPRGIVVVVLLLVVPAFFTLLSRRVGFVASACAVAILVYLVLRNERRGPRPG